jgi:hypothetical protein
MTGNLIAALLLSAVLSACGSLAVRGLLPEVQSRRPPNVDLGPQIVLLDGSITSSTSLIGTDGRVHIFATDAKKQLRHIEVLGDVVVKSEILGMTEADDKAAIDSVEQPAGKLRVLVGDRQFVRAAPELSWQEFKGNRCQRVLAIRNELYCAFVIKGEEIGAPKRTDYTVGLVFIVPWVSWSNKQAAKLVIAQELAKQISGDSWVIRAVVDPENPLDADSDFMVGTDNQGMLHVLYAASRGGGFFIVGAGPGGGGGAGWEPTPELRYAQFPLDRLVARSADTEDQTPNPDIAPPQWLSIVGDRLFFPPRQRNLPLPIYRETAQDEVEFFESGIRPLDRLFIVNKAAGSVSGLASGSIQRMLFDKDQMRIPWGGGYWVEFRIDSKKWLPGYDIVTAEDLPVSGYGWSGSRRDVVIKADTKGTLYALLSHYSGGGFFTGADLFMDYFVKSSNGWSAPLTLGRSYSSILAGTPRTLAVTDSGSAFAAWVDRDKKFVGRWVRPRGPIEG